MHCGGEVEPIYPFGVVAQGFANKGSLVDAETCRDTKIVDIDVPICGRGKLSAEKLADFGVDAGQIQGQMFGEI